jgi:carbohydrate-selective porin OprB
MRLSGTGRYVVGGVLAAVTGANLLSTAFAQPVDIEKELTETRELEVPLFEAHPWRRFRHAWLDEMERLDRDVGLRLGTSFTTIYQHAAGVDSPNNASVGNLDIFAHWRLLDLGVFGQGAIAALFRTRANMAELNGNDLSARVGTAWGINDSGSPGYNRFNQFWWEQTVNRTLVLKVGRLDQASLFQQNRVASSDGRQFLMQPLVQSQTVAFPSNGGGLNLRYEPSPRFYISAGFGDASGNPDVKPREGLDSFVQGKYFEAVEIGVSPDLAPRRAGVGQGTYRFMGWHTAATATHAGGDGFALSVDQEVGDGIVPFLRFGVCPDDAFRTSVELSGGIATVRPFGRPSDRAGIGATWGKPVAASRRDQFAAEVFYRLEAVEGIALTPDVELIPAPANQPRRDFVAVLGLRTRLSL